MGWVEAYVFQSVAGRADLPGAAMKRGWPIRLVRMLLFLAVVGVASGLSSGQMSSSPPSQTNGNLHPRDDGEREPFPPDLEAKALKMRNEQRQKQLVSDTGKLVALARELEAEVGRSPASPLALSTLKKAEEVEKLARSVKDKMKAD